MELPRDWQEFLSSLNARKVRYLVVGAHALAAHGAPRYTADFDVWVAADPANARRVLAALGDFGFASVKGLTVEDFENPEMVVMLGRPPPGQARTSRPKVWRKRDAQSTRGRTGRAGAGDFSAAPDGEEKATAAAAWRQGLCDGGVSFSTGRSRRVTTGPRGN